MSNYREKLPMQKVVRLNYGHSLKYEDDYLNRLFKYLKKWKESLDSGNNVLTTHLQLLEYTHILLVQEQKMPELRVTKRLVSLSQQLNCANPEYNQFLLPKKRKKPSKIIDLVLFGYELTIIEIRLFELYDVVDEFLIFESNKTFKRIKKPFFFQMNLRRFQKFLDKIILITPFNIIRYNKTDLSVIKKIEINDVDIPEEYKLAELPEFYRNETIFFISDFSVELWTRMLPLRLYIKYVRQIESDEIIIHGDTDELISGNIVNHFKYCEIREEHYPFSASSTFYIYNFNHLVTSDHAVVGDKYTLIYPNILHLEDIYRARTPRLPKAASLLPRASGCHCSRFHNTFTMGLYKGMSQSDGGGIGGAYLDVINQGTIESLKKLQYLFNNARIDDDILERIKVTQSLTSNETVFVPWVVLANKHAYSNFID